MNKAASVKAFAMRAVCKSPFKSALMFASIRIPSQITMPQRLMTTNPYQFFPFFLKLSTTKIKHRIQSFKLKMEGVF